MLRGDLAVFSTDGSWMDMSSLVEDGSVLRIVNAKVPYDPLPTFRFKIGSTRLNSSH